MKGEKTTMVLLDTDKEFVQKQVQSILKAKLKGRISVDIIGDAVVVSFTAPQDIVYTYTHYLDNTYDFVDGLEGREIIAHFIAKKALKRYKRYLKNLFFQHQKRLDILDTSLYTR